MARQPKSLATTKIGGLLEGVKKSEQLISMLMGVAVVLLVGYFSYRYFQGRQIARSNVVSEETSSIAETAGIQSSSIIHKVAEGEDLWNIAEKYYSSGYNWVDIAKKNNLKNPNILTAGQELTIPNVTPKGETIGTSIKTEAPDGNREYVVQKGDYLSKIAVNFYGNGKGYQWTIIWQENKAQIKNPNLISPGQKLRIPY